MSETPPNQDPAPTPEPAAPESTPTPEAVSAPEPTAAPQAAPATDQPAVAPTAPSAPDQKSTALLIWVLTIFVGWIPGLIFFLTAKDKPFVRRQGGMALGWALMVTILYIATSFIHIPFVGFGTVGLLNLVVCILGAIEVNKGNDFEVPVIGKFISDTFKL